MRRMLLRWLALLVFVAMLGTAFVLLGQWQLRRLDERRAANATVTRNEGAPVVDFADAFRGPVGDGDQWARVRATGRYDYAHQVIVRYRSDAGRQGYEVVTPLVAGDRTVLVDRGLVAASPGDAPVAPPGPTGDVTVVGYVKRSERGDAKAVTPVGGQLRLINADAIGRAQGVTYVDGYLALISSDPAQDARLVPLAPPQLDEGPHLSYALQWFTFTGIAVLGMIVFIRSDLRERRKARAAAAATAGPPGTADKE